MKMRVCFLSLLLVFMWVVWASAVTTCDNGVLVYKGTNKISEMEESEYSTGIDKVFLVVDGCFDFDGYFQQAGASFLISYAKDDEGTSAEVYNLNNSKIIYDKTTGYSAFYAADCLGDNIDASLFIHGKTSLQKVGGTGVGYQIPKSLAGAMVEIDPQYNLQINNTLNLSYDKPHTIKANNEESNANSVLESILQELKIDDWAWVNNPAIAGSYEVFQMSSVGGATITASDLIGKWNLNVSQSTWQGAPVPSSANGSYVEITAKNYREVEYTNGAKTEDETVPYTLTGNTLCQHTTTHGDDCGTVTLSADKSSFTLDDHAGWYEVFQKSSGGGTTNNSPAVATKKNAGGAITVGGQPVGKTRPVAAGEGETFVVTANPGFHIVSIALDGNVLISDTAAHAPYLYISYNVPVTDTGAAKRQLMVKFASNNYTATSSASGPGKITPVGGKAYKYGKKATYTIKPDKGAQIESLLVNGDPVDLTGADLARPYKLQKMIDADLSIVATFITIPTP